MYEIALWFAEPPRFILWYPLFTCLVGFVVGYFTRKSEEKEDTK